MKKDMEKAKYHVSSSPQFFLVRLVVSAIDRKVWSKEESLVEDDQMREYFKNPRWVLGKLANDIVKSLLMFFP